MIINRQVYYQLVICAIPFGIITTIVVAWFYAGQRRGEESKFWIHVVRTEPISTGSLFVRRERFGISEIEHEHRTVRFVWHGNECPPVSRSSYGGDSERTNSVARRALERMSGSEGWRANPVVELALMGGWGRLPKEDHAIEMVASGWPFRAVWGWREWSRTKPSERRWLIGIPGRPPEAIWGNVPYRPIPLGFVANSAIFAAVWWIALAAPLFAVRTRRRLHGTCLCCGYSFAGLTGTGSFLRCPECGAKARTPAAA